MREGVATFPKNRANRLSVKPAEVLTGTRTITFEEVERFNVMVFGPNVASRNVDLPAVAACQGVDLTIVNLSTAVGATLVVRDSAGATILTIPETTATTRKSARLLCDGTAWFGTLGA